MPAKDGDIVWHDLVTPDVAKACRFYAELFGWAYSVEHAPDFAWSDGDDRPGDYPLIMADGVAHGGMIDLGSALPPQWLAYVAVVDVDETVTRASDLGATVLRSPFDVPGVGRNAVIRDPGGAVICPSRASHDFPPPQGVFDADVLCCHEPERSVAFYRTVFAWQDSFECIAVAATEKGKDRWIPRIGVMDLRAATEKALSIGARPFSAPATGPGVTLLEDPIGAVFGLVSRPAIDPQ